MVVPFFGHISARLEIRMAFREWRRIRGSNVGYARHGAAVIREADFVGDTRHSKYVTFQLAEVAMTRRLFAAILARIEQLAIPPPLVARAHA
jgi:hypothetical protein